MSVSASIDLRVVSRSSKKPISQMQILIKNGWNLQRNGYVCFLPIGDGDNFAWEALPMSIESLMEILQEKENKGELIGVLTTWQDSEIEGDLLLWSNQEIEKDPTKTSFSLNVNATRKILLEYGRDKITDVNWYLTKLLPAFNQGDTRVEYFSYDENI